MKRERERERERCGGKRQSATVRVLTTPTVVVAIKIVKKSASNEAR